MTKQLFLFLIVILVVGCKKSNDSTAIYQWKRELYRAIVTKDGPATLPSSDPKAINAIFVKADFVFLTEVQKKTQQDSIFHASDRILAYKYERVERVLL